MEKPRPKYFMSDDSDSDIILSDHDDSDAFDPGSFMNGNTNGVSEKKKKEPAKKKESKPKKEPAKKKEPAAKNGKKKENSSKKKDTSTSNNDDSMPPSPSPAPKKAPAKNKNIEEIYQKKTQLEHILLRPDTYIGSIETVTDLMWVMEDEQLVQRQITYVPGLYKIFDEILVNAADNKQRDPKHMDEIKINIDRETSTIMIQNNGEGIPVIEHQTEKMLVPTMIFGHLLTSSNFDDEEKKVTGGRNGYGAKLCNVFSKKFTLETASKKYKKSFKQTWENNMSKASEPKIKEFNGADFTKITFTPDLAKFKMDSFDDDVIALFNRRAYDVAATAKVKVILNGKRVPVKNFKEYINLFLENRKDDSGTVIKFQHELASDRWEVAVAPSENGFQQNSFVNSIATTKGGRHIDYISDMVVKSMMETIKKKNKEKTVDIKPFQIKNHMWIFVNCLIENPTFDSQTKENMTLQAKSFGSKCLISEKFWAGVLKSGIVESVLQWAKFKAENMLSKAQSGKKQNKIKGVPKLEDANDAGTKHSVECTLILTEGDSAKSLAVAGLGVIGRDRYGVFPLKGKLLNVREASTKQIMENAEICALVKIIGLQYKKKYSQHDDLKTLRYGKLMIMTDQDHDGSHIKGLIINFIHHNWPNLLKLNFIEEFITPIVKVSKGSETISFFSMPEMVDWKSKTANWRNYKIKYYKGLGTSTSKEAKEYFSDMPRHRIKFRYQGSVDDEQICMAFSKKCVEERKTWLTGWMEERKRREELGIAEDIIYDKNVRSITFHDFVNKELVLFSNLDNERSIPSMVDGLKPGQRKVLYTCFKRNDKREIKVAQLAGSVAEHSAYHHGEASLMSTIINLAQNYVGSNNINLLQPIGQFGTRLQGGKDAASPRYIFTMLSPLARLIFDQKDDAVLKNLFDDNQKIEPEWYCPILPMVLVNGCDGIGTGWMTKVPNFNPRQIVNNIRRMLRDEDPVRMSPWYKNFRGEIIEISSQKYAANGEISLLDDSRMEITELPIAKWTQDYKENVMEIMLQGSEKISPMISDYKEYHTDTTVKFVVTMKPEQMSKYEDEGLHKTFKLQATVNLTSMVLFDKNGVLRKYESVEQILKDFYELRLDIYKKRRDYLLGMLGAEALKLSNQARFIVEKCNGTITVENKKRKVLIEELVTRKYDSDPVKSWKTRQIAISGHQQVEENNEDNENEETQVDDDRDFDYILGMAMWSLTQERKDDLIKKKLDKQNELDLLKKKSEKDLYNDDLDKFLEELEKIEKAEIEENANVKKKLVGKKTFSKRALVEHAPSPVGQKVAPRIDDLVKKAEAAKTAKQKKAAGGGGGGGGRKGKGKENGVKDEIKDEWDLMVEDSGDENFLDKVDSILENSADFGKEKEKGKKDVKGKKPTGAAAGAKKPRKPKEPGSPKVGKDKLKQTKLDFKPKEKNEFNFSSGSSDESDSDVYTISDSDEAPKKKKAVAISDSDDELEFIPKKTQETKAAPSKPSRPITIDSSDDDEEEKVKEKPEKKKPQQKKKRISDSEDDDDEFSVSPPKKAKKESDSDSDDYIVASNILKDTAAGDRARRNVPKTKYVFDDDEESD